MPRPKVNHGLSDEVKRDLAWTTCAWVVLPLALLAQATPSECPGMWRSPTSVLGYQHN